MRVLLVNTVPTGRNGITGVIMNYLIAGCYPNMTFDLLSINDPEARYVERVERYGGKSYVLRRTGANVLLYWIRLRDLIHRNKYDAVHIHGNSHTIVLELSAAYFSGCRIRIAHCHNTACSHPLIHRLLSYPFSKLYTHAFACGEAAGRWMFGGDSFVVLNNGVDVPRFSFNVENRNSMRQFLGYDDNIVVGHVGSFIAVKNQSFLITIIKGLIKRDARYRLLLVGDGPMIQKVKDCVDEEPGLDKYVSFVGAVDNVEAYLSAIDVVAMPSLFEGLPLTLIEQQVNGLPCVVSDAVSSEADFSGFMTFLSLDNPAEEWIDALIYACHAYDRNELSAIAVSNVKRAGFDINEEAKKYARYLLQAS